MITLTSATVTGDAGMTLAEMDAVTLQAAWMLGGPCQAPEVAADFLRDVYGAVIRTAGAVTLTITRQHGMPVAVEVAA